MLIALPPLLIHYGTDSSMLVIKYLSKTGGVFSKNNDAVLPPNNQSRSAAPSPGNGKKQA